jgi:hypothetical protein
MKKGWRQVILLSNMESEKCTPYFERRIREVDFNSVAAIAKGPDVPLSERFINVEMINFPSDPRMRYDVFFSSFFTNLWF